MSISKIVTSNFFSHDNWISKLVKKMSRIPAYCWLAGCSKINSILTWIFSQIILRSHCAFCTVTVHLTCVIFAFFLKLGQKWCQSCQRPTPIGHFFVFLWCLVYACYIFVTFEFVLWCTIVQQSTNSDFTMVYRCVKGFKGCFCRFDRTQVKMGQHGWKSKQSFAGKFGSRNNMWIWG